MQNNELEFSVLMSVYNKENSVYLQSCLQSLVDQTLKADEIILVEDGSIGEDLERVISDFKKFLPIKSILLKKNVGLASALNIGIGYCTHELILRMDTDDVALPLRFERQVAFMHANPDVAVCSAYIEEKNDDMSLTLNTRILPTDHDSIIQFAKTRSPISHPVTIYRKSIILAVGGYPLIYPEDYPLWCILIAKGYKFANLPEILLHMRSGDGMISRRGVKILKGYLKTYWIMRKFNLIGWSLFVRNMIIQICVRLSPIFVRKMIYQYARK